MLKKGVSPLLAIDQSDGNERIIEKMILKMLYFERRDVKEHFAVLSRKNIECIIKALAHKPPDAVKENKFFFEPLLSEAEKKTYTKKMKAMPSYTTFQTAFTKLEFQGLVEKCGTKERSTLYGLTDKGVVLLQGSERDSIMTHTQLGFLSYLEFCPEIMGVIGICSKEAEAFKQILSVIGRFGFTLGWHGTTSFYGRVGFASDHKINFPKKLIDRLTDITYSYLDKEITKEAKGTIDGTIRVDFGFFRPLNPEWYFEQGKMYRAYVEADENERPDIEAKIKKRLIEDPQCLDHIYSLIQLAAIFILQRNQESKEKIIDELREIRRLRDSYSSALSLSDPRRQEFIRNHMIHTFFRTYVFPLVDRAQQLKQQFEYLRKYMKTKNASAGIVKLWSQTIFELIGVLQPVKCADREEFTRSLGLNEQRQKICYDPKTWKTVQKVAHIFQEYCDYVKENYGLSPVDL